MDVRILYLDIDDEITTAANRVREADATRIAMVLPYGSRVATSRINFRLLSRDATLNGKRLDRRGRRGDSGAGGIGRAADLRDGGGVRVVCRRRDGSKPPPAGDAPGAVAGAAAAAAVTPSRSPRGSGGRNPRGEISSGVTRWIRTFDDTADRGRRGRCRWGRDRGRWHRGRRRDTCDRSCRRRRRLLRSRDHRWRIASRRRSRRHASWQTRRPMRSRPPGRG